MAMALNISWNMGGGGGGEGQVVREDCKISISRANLGKWRMI